MTVIQFPGGKPEKPAAPAAVKELVSAESDIEIEIARDRWKRPLIIPPGGGDPVAYRRASSVAEVVTDHFGLDRWRHRMAAQGFAQRPDLVHSIHTATGGELDAIIDEAIEQAGGSVPSRNGRTMHSLTERLDNGGDVPKGLPANITRMLELYREKVVDRFVMLDTEQFVVCDRIQVAGTYDRRMLDRKTGIIYIGDLKTGQSLKHLALSTPAQVAVYASGKKYDLDGEREDHHADRDRGLIIHLPWVDDPSEAVCEIRYLDLNVGRAVIKEAFRIHKIRKITEAQSMPRFK